MKDDLFPEVQGASASTPDTNELGKRMKARAADPTECQEYAKQIGLHAEDGEWFFHHMEASGWLNAGKPVKQWRSCMSAWRLQKYFPSQRNRGRVVSSTDFPSVPTPARETWQIKNDLDIVSKVLEDARYRERFAKDAKQLSELKEKIEKLRKRKLELEEELSS